MAIKLTQEAFKRFQVYRVRDSEAFDAIRRRLARIDHDCCRGTRVQQLFNPPSNLDPAQERLYARLRNALRGLQLPHDARIGIEPLRSSAADAPLVAVVHCPRDLEVGRANATVIALGLILRQPGSQLR